MVPFKHHATKPVIGLAGGIGSGKSSIARLFAGEGCAVIDSDADAHRALQTGEVKGLLREWMGEGIFLADGSVSRRAVGARVFSDAGAVERLNGIIHPRVAAMREEQMARHLADPGVKGIVWDTPLLFEVGLNRECDAVVFVEVPRETRLLRVKASRGWSAEELDKREKLQFSLDKKTQFADYCINNNGDEATSLVHVQQVLSQILALAN